MQTTSFEALAVLVKSNSWVLVVSGGRDLLPIAGIYAPVGVLFELI